MRYLLFNSAFICTTYIKKNFLLFSFSFRPPHDLVDLPPRKQSKRAVYSSSGCSPSSRFASEASSSSKYNTFFNIMDDISYSCSEKTKEKQLFTERNSENQQSSTLDSEKYNFRNTSLSDPKNEKCQKTPDLNLSSSDELSTKV